MGFTRTFLIGSSIAIFPIMYLGRSYSKLTCDQVGKLKISYGKFIPLLWLLYGLTYTLLKYIFNYFNIHNTYRMFILGAVAGELYSLVGHFVLDIPGTIFRSKNPYNVHLIAPIMYSLIYGIWVSYLEKNV